MNARLARGVVTISIDLEVEGALKERVAERAVEEVTFWLHEVLDKYELPATWAMADPTASAASERILSLGPRNEIAVLGEAAWIGRQAGRGRFGRELARRLERNRGAAPISTLVLKSGELGELSDLAIKHGITAVRHAPSADEGIRGRSQPQTLRHGLWSFPVSLVLPGASRWLPGGGGLRAARSGIDRAVESRGLFQVAIDASRLVVRGSSAHRLVERVLQYVHRFERQGELDVAHLRSVAERLSSQQQSQPSRSILSPAA
jgi:hypothetical protein